MDLNLLCVRLAVIVTEEDVIHLGRRRKVRWKFALSSGEDPSHLSWL